MNGAGFFFKPLSFFKQLSNERVLKLISVISINFIMKKERSFKIVFPLFKSEYK